MISKVYILSFWNNPLCNLDCLEIRLAFKISLVLADLLILTFGKESIILLVADTFSTFKSVIDFLFLNLFLYFHCAGLVFILKCDGLTNTSWFLSTLNCSNYLELGGDGRIRLTHLLLNLLDYLLGRCLYDYLLLNIGIEFDLL